MIVKSTLLLLGAVSAAAADQVPISESSACLASATPNDCCTGGVETGQVSIKGRTFKFTCESKLMAMNPNNAQNVESAHACASLCAGDMSCEASTFKAYGKAARGGNNCFFMIGDNMDQKSDENWITFTEVPPSPPSPPSCLDSNDPKACCSDPEKEEEVVLDNVRWKLTCNSILRDLNFKGKEAPNPRECAALCASQGCDAISFRTVGTRRDTCFFVRHADKEQKPSDRFLSLVKVGDNPPGPEPDCKECDAKQHQCIQDKAQCIKDKEECVKEKNTCKDDLEKTDHNLQVCQNNRVDPAKLTQCEAEKRASQNAEQDCRRHSTELEEKRKQCRADQQKCEQAKGDLNIQKQQCENDKNSLNLQLTEKDDEITKLNSKITSLNGKLETLQNSYDALNVDCNGEGPNGKCRTNLYDAEPRDDQCIIAAGNERFKIHYAKLDDEGPADLGTPRANSFKDCAEKCANYKGAKKCVRFMWNTDGKDRACYMRSHGLGMVPTKSSRWSSGQLL